MAAATPAPAATGGRTSTMITVLGTADGLIGGVPQLFLPRDSLIQATSNVRNVSIHASGGSSGIDELDLFFRGPRNTPLTPGFYEPGNQQGVVLGDQPVMAIVTPTTSCPSWHQ